VIQHTHINQRQRSRDAFGDDLVGVALILYAARMVMKEQARSPLPVLPLGTRLECGQTPRCSSAAQPTRTDRLAAEELWADFWG